MVKARVAAALVDVCNAERRVQTFTRLPVGTTLRVLGMYTTDTPRGTTVVKKECFGLVKRTKQTDVTQWVTVAYYDDETCSGRPYETHVHDLAAPTPIYILKRARDPFGAARIPDMSFDSEERADELLSEAAILATSTTQPPSPLFP